MSPSLQTIYINGGFLASRSITGIERYAREIIRELDLRLASDPNMQCELVILAPKNSSDVPKYRGIKVRRVGFLTGHAWVQFELPFYCRGQLLFSPGGGAPLLHKRNVVTIHDAAVVAAPQGYSFTYRKWFGFLYGFWSRHALKVMTVSEFSKAELIRWFGAPEEKIVVTHLGRDHVFSGARDPDILRKHGIIPKRYILGVASANPNKNIRALGAAMDNLKDIDIPLVIAGGRNDRSFDEEGPLPKNVKRLGYVKDPELLALYEHAACFVFPSLYEGFGLPPLEASTLGTPVVVGYVASLPEVYQGIALFVDPRDPEDIARGIRSALNGEGPPPADRNALVSQYSWERCACETWTVLQSREVAHG